MLPVPFAVKYKVRFENQITALGIATKSPHPASLNIAKIGGSGLVVESPAMFAKGIFGLKE